MKIVQCFLLLGKAFIATVICLFIYLPPTFCQKKNKANKVSSDAIIPQTTGIEDRAFWANTLYKISYPVIHNLAQGTLRKNMPLEKGFSYQFGKNEVTYLEAVGRTMAGVAPWLALPDDETKEGIQRKQLRNDLLEGIKNAVDPSSPDYLNFTHERQPIVDASYMAHAFIRAPKALWEPLDKITKQRVIHEFKVLRTRSSYYNNWLLFAGITEAFLLSIGEEVEPVRIEFARMKIKEWYVGDGWYSDGEKFSFDNYNSYVIHSMLVDMLKILLEKKQIQQPEYDEALKRMIRYSEFLERYISPEGTYPVFGRSVTYRTAAFQALAHVALIEKLPEHILPAQVRCGLTKVMHNMFDGKQNFDENGWLVLGFNGHQPMMADTYTSTGSLYICTIGFLALGLPQDNAFWKNPPADWTSKKAWSGQPVKKDYKVEY